MLSLKQSVQGLYKFALLALFSLVLACPGLASVPQKKEEYLKYLLLKKEAAQLNIKNVRTKNFIPQDVVWNEKEGVLLVPRPDPFIKVFIPEDPDANLHGIVLYPRIDKDQELEKLRFVQQELQRLNYAKRPKTHSTPSL